MYKLNNEIISILLLLMYTFVYGCEDNTCLYIDDRIYQVNI